MCYHQDPSSAENPFVRSNFPCSKFDFLQRLSHFREIRENLLQRLSDFFNGFPIFLNDFSISEKYEKIYFWWQVYERSLFELCISRHSLPELRNSCKLITIHHTVLQVLKTCMMKWLSTKPISTSDNKTRSPS